jgi:hypothetical protein
MSEELEEEIQEEAGVQELEAEVARLKELLQSREELSQLRGEVASSVERYRALMLATSPELPEELVAEATVEEIDASVEKARQLVERVRRQIESQREKERFPAGAPPRMPADLSSLSPQGKIAYALTKGK